MEYQLPALIWLLWDLKLLRQKHLQQVTVAFWTSLSLASLSTMYALYQVSVRQATISLSFFSPTPRGVNLGSRFGVRWQLRPLWTFTTD